MKRTSKPKTRAQIRKEEIEKGQEKKGTGKTQQNEAGYSRKKAEEKANLKIIEDIDKHHTEKQKGWTNVKDVENKLRLLEDQYVKTTNETTRRQIRKLIDVYEKQIKVLNIKTAKQQETAAKVKKQEEVINIDQDDDDHSNTGTVMSDTTIMTNNSKS